MHNLYIIIVYLMCKKEETKKITENHVQSHPVGIRPPLQPFWSHVQRQKPLPPLQMNLKASHHHAASPRPSPPALPAPGSSQSAPCLYSQMQKHSKGKQNTTKIFSLCPVQVQCRSCFKGRKKGNIDINLPVTFLIQI